MATSSHRKNAINGLVTVLKTVNGGPTYFNDFSGAGVVAQLRESIETVTTQRGKVTLRVYDGAEVYGPRPASGGTVTAQLELLIQVVAKNVTAQNLVDHLNDVLADINLILGANSTLGGVCSTSYLTSIDPPEYQFDAQLAQTLVRILVEYDFSPGVNT